MEFSQGYDLMEAFGLREKEYASIKGVALEPYIFLGTHTYTLYRDIQLTRQTRHSLSVICVLSEVFASGIPSEYTVTFLLRLLPESPRESFAVWQVTDEDFQPLLGIVLDPNKKSLTYFRRDYDADIEEVTFDQQDVKKLFYGSFHKVLIRKETFVRTIMLVLLLGCGSENILKIFANFSMLVHVLKC
uniref:Uncharacterized protein n=1 Tax=Sphaerodactylus townsendi TaxID=933632 RepID=A0ACB8F6R9_9SAUR